MTSDILTLTPDRASRNLKVVEVIRALDSIRVDVAKAALLDEDDARVNQVLYAVRAAHSILNECLST